MTPLAIDACAALHAKQTGALPVLGMFVEHGLPVFMSTGVYTESVKMTLSEWLADQGVPRFKVERRQRMQVKNRCRRRRIAGDKDLELVAAAKAEHAVLLSHDELCAEAARRNGLLVVDLVDLVGLASEQDWIENDAVLLLDAKLGAHAWVAPDWRGTVARTLTQRDQQVLDSLRDRWSLRAPSIGEDEDSAELHEPGSPEPPQLDFDW